MRRREADPVRVLATILALGMIAYFTMELVLEDDPWDELTNLHNFSGPTPATASNHDRTCSTRDDRHRHDQPAGF